MILIIDFALFYIYIVNIYYFLFILFKVFDYLFLKSKISHIFKVFLKFEYIEFFILN